MTVDQINDHFATLGERAVRRSVGFVDATKDLPPVSRRKFGGFQTPDLEYLRNAMSRLENHKASGLDGLPCRMFKEGKIALSAPVQAIIDKIINSCSYPLTLKVALLHTVHKSGAFSDIDNYRPISLLSALNKVIEKVLSQQLSDYMEDNLLLSPAQYGFRKGTSCEDAAVRLYDFVTKETLRSQFFAI